MPGVGRVAGRQLIRQGIRTVADLQRLGARGLAVALGGTLAHTADASAGLGAGVGRRAELMARAEELLRYSHGIDESTVELVRPR